MSAEQQAHLFEPFSQLDGANKRDRGTGLGLAISQELVHLMGGKIAVESSLGEGSEFSFELELGVPSTQREPRPKLEGELCDWRVLVVDDSALAREVLTRGLLAMGFTVCGVGSAREALAQLDQADDRQQPFQLALLDVRLPETDGVELAQQIAARTWKTRRPDLVMISAYARDEVAQGRDLSSVRAFLRKPISRSTLYDTVLDVADARRGSIRPSAPAPAPKERPRPLSAIDLLVVEDNEINQILARDLLEAAGAKVTIASDGSEAIRICAERAFDLILMDVQMPGMDGHTTTRKLRLSPRTQATPIIAMTAHAFDAERKKCIESGMNAHISKPINPPELIRTVLTWARASTPVTDVVPPPPRTPVIDDHEPVIRAFESAVIANPSSASRTAPAPLPDFDPNALAVVFRDPARQLSFLRKFVDSAHLTLAELHGAWERRAEAEISFAGHKLKSSAKACGAHALAALCTQLELRAKEGDWATLAPLEGKAEALLAEVAKHVEALERR